MSPREIKIGRASWIHNKDGVDYGPYDSDTITQMILSGDVKREDSLRDQYSGQTCQPNHVPTFAEALNNFETERQDAQIAREADTSYSNLKKRRRHIPVFILLATTLVVSSGWETIEQWLDPSSRHTALTAVTVPITPDPDVNIRALPSATSKELSADASDSQSDASTIKVRQKKPARARKKRRATAPRPSETPPTDQVQEFDFSDEEAGADDDDALLPSPLGASELRQYLSEKLKPAVMRCVRVHREELVLPSYKVLLKLKPSGAVSLTSVAPASAEVPTLKQCLSLQIKRNQFRPFTGAERKLELPIKVQ